ncbi:MAG: hypothetical protein HOP29_16830 [Phycisphaerales bacterium]|nr:hypothetical protein [Phycisphaerales bacterium]
MWGLNSERGTVLRRGMTTHAKAMSAVAFGKREVTGRRRGARSVPHPRMGRGTHAAAARIIAAGAIVFLAAHASRADDAINRHSNAQGDNLAEDGTPLTVVSGAARETVTWSAETGGPTAAGVPVVNVAIVASASGNVSDPFFTDPRDRLLLSGLFASVTIIHAGQVTPTVAELRAFDAVLVWSNQDLADAGALGDNLADYVDGGGGVVLAVFSNSSSTSERFLEGKWLSAGYAIIPGQSGTQTGSASLGTVVQPGHAIMNGVTAFAGGSSSFRPAAAANPSDVVAEWSDGRTLAAVREDTVGARVDLGFYPVSDAVLPSFWDDATDGGALLANALLYAAERVPLTLGDGDDDGDVDGDDFAEFEICFTGAGGSVPADCAVYDFDGDDDVDCHDHLAFAMAWTAGGGAPAVAACAGFCLDDMDCVDADPCTLDRCQADFCQNIVLIHGDVNHDGGVDIFDILCVLDGFAGEFGTCPLVDVDLTPCAPDGVVDIFDILDVLDAFAGVFTCPAC